MIDRSGLSLLGLGARAGTTVVGTGGVRAALQRNGLVLVVVAGDRSDRTAAKVVRLAEARGVAVMWAESAAALGGVLGRGPVQAIGVRDRALADGLLARAGRQLPQEG